MQYAKGFGTYTTQQESMLEALQEIEDVVTIAKTVAPKGDIKLVINNLDQVSDYIEHIRRKVKIALRYVPESVQEKEFL